MPGKPVKVRILGGFGKGACLFLKIRDSLRVIFGLYEPELSEWCREAAKDATVFMDIGANYGSYIFSFAAAFRKWHPDTKCMVVGFEPPGEALETLKRSVAMQRASNVDIKVVEAFVDAQDGDGRVAFSNWWARNLVPAASKRKTAVLIDVEGHELDVVKGMLPCLDSSFMILIEVHDANYVSPLQQMLASAGINTKTIQRGDLGHLDPVSRFILRCLGPESRSQQLCWLASSTR